MSSPSYPGQPNPSTQWNGMMGAPYQQQVISAPHKPNMSLQYSKASQMAGPEQMRPAIGSVSEVQTGWPQMSGVATPQMQVTAPQMQQMQMANMQVAIDSTQQMFAQVVQQGMMG